MPPRDCGSRPLRCLRVAWSLELRTAPSDQVETVGRISLMEHDLTVAKPASARDRHQPAKLRLGQAAEELDIAHKRSVTVVTRRVSPLRRAAKTGRRSAVSWT